MSCNFCLKKHAKGWYFHNLPTKDALRFYTDIVEPHAATFQIAIVMTAVQYNSAVKKGTFLDYLNSLSMNTYTNKGMIESKTLTNMYYEVVCLSPHCLSFHKCDANQTRITRKVVLQRPWSHPALQCLASTGLQFQ